MSPDELREKLMVVDHWDAALRRLGPCLMEPGRVRLVRASGSCNDVTYFAVMPWPLIFTGFDNLSRSASERLLRAIFPTAEKAGENQNTYQISGNDRVLFELLERA